MILHLLPSEHPLRNKPLGEIGAECRNCESTVWRSVATWHISKFTFNQLSIAWTHTNEFRAQQERP